MASKQQYYNSVYSMARALGASDVQAHLAASQSALETGYGRSVKGDNYFGIKAGSQYGGPTVTFGTHEIIGGQRVNMKDRFRAYSGLRDSVRDYMGFMARRFPRAWNATNFGEAIRGLKAGKAGGYATDPNYAGKLNRIASRFGEGVSSTEEDAATAFMKGNPQPGGFGLAGFRSGIEESAIPIPTPRASAIFPETGPVPKFREDALAEAATEASNTAALRDAASSMRQAGVRGLGAMPQPGPAGPNGLAAQAPTPPSDAMAASNGLGDRLTSTPAPVPGMADAYRQYADSRIAAVHTPPPSAAAAVAPVVPGAPTLGGLGVPRPDMGPIPSPRLPDAPSPGPLPVPTVPPLEAPREVRDYQVAAAAQPSVSLPEEGPVPTLRTDYFPPAPSEYFPAAPTATGATGAFPAATPFWQTNAGGLGRFGGVMRGAAMGAAVGGLPGAVVGGVLGSGVLKKVFNNDAPSAGTPRAGAPSRGGYIGSGVNAMASVFSGKAAPGTVAESRSNPGTYAMSLPGGLVARSYTSPTHGFITGIYGLGPDEDTNPGAKFGKVAALAPDAKSWSFVTPDEARGLQAKGWSVSIGPASKTSIAAPAEPAKEAKAPVTAAPSPAMAAKATPDATPGRSLGQAVSDIGKAVAQAFGIGPAAVGVPGGLGAVTAAPAAAYGLGAYGGGTGGMTGAGLGAGAYSGANDGWGGMAGPEGNRT